MINQAINIDGLINYLLCPMQCHLIGVQVNEVPKFLAETPSERTYAIELVDRFDDAHPLIILLKVSSVTSYFDVYSPSITEYENGRRATLGYINKQIFRKRDLNVRQSRSD